MKDPKLVAVIWESALNDDMALAVIVWDKDAEIVEEFVERGIRNFWDDEECCLCYGDAVCDELMHSGIKHSVIFCEPADFLEEEIVVSDWEARLDNLKTQGIELCYIRV